LADNPGSQDQESEPWRACSPRSIKGESKVTDFGGGYVGKVLEVDLSAGKWKSERLDPTLAESYVGGRGFTSRIQYQRLTRGTDPLGPDNVLVFATGPLNGTSAPSASRLTIGAKSPLTGLLGDSNVGGAWGPVLKHAGYDMVVVTGRSPRPVYLSITDDAVEIRDARELWGKDTLSTQASLKKNLGANAKVLCIGPAGENLVPYACVMSEAYHAAGRTGMGAVMGSKNLKAIVVRGSGRVPIADPARFRDAVSFCQREIKNDPVSGEISNKLGTLRYTAGSNDRGALCTRNWQTGVFEGIEKIRGEYVVDHYKVSSHACYGCTVACGQVLEIPETFFGGARVKVEYYPLVSFSSKCGNAHVESVIKAIELCNRLGLDTGSTGQAIAFAMECNEKGLLRHPDAKHHDFGWGQHETILALIPKIAFRKGVGDFLALGVQAMSEEIGPASKSFAIHVRGLCPPTVDPRAVKAYNFRYVVSSRGGDHLRAQGIQGSTLDRGPIPEAIEMVRFNEEGCVLVDTTGLCKFPYHMDSASLENIKRKHEGLRALYAAATGQKEGPSPLSSVTKRIRDLDRVLNARFGATRSGDTLPERFLKEPLPEGPMKGSRFDALEQLLEEYYRQCGWDTATGLPPEGVIKELNA
jgi:aldehyde:ferredoxin oxidoreductase